MKTFLNSSVVVQNQKIVSQICVTELLQLLENIANFEDKRFVQQIIHHLKSLELQSCPMKLYSVCELSKWLHCLNDIKYKDIYRTFPKECLLLETDTPFAWLFEDGEPFILEQEDSK